VSNRSDVPSAGGLTAAEESAYAQRGKALANQISIFLKTAKMHTPDNNSFRTQLDLTRSLILQSLTEIYEMTLQVQSSYLFFCGVRIKSDADGAISAKFMVDYFHKLGISGLVITAGISNEELQKMAVILNQCDSENVNEFEQLQTRFDAAQIESIELLPPVVESKSEVDEERTKRAFARKTFFYAVNNLKHVTNLISAGKPIDLSRTNRVIHSLVDQIMEDDSYLLELTALKSHDEYTYVHSANVCIYSVRLGAGLNLSKNELSNLGFAGLFHDIGKTKLPLQVLNKPTDFDEDEWELMRKHPTYGVLAIAKTMPFDEKSCRAMLVAFEHHFNLDGTGYPLVNFKRKLNLYSKIVTICDVFDALTSGRIYRKNPISPEHVLRNMMQQAGFKFDPHLLKVFFNAVSLYPPGTLLLLDQDNLAVVVGRNEHDLFRPKVKLIGNTGGLYDEGIRIDLSEKNPHSGEYIRSIVRVLDPLEAKIDVTPYILEAC
jgi:HD-GYP domain-containing protein (c-di-GMP phosphodiesterase class II)